MKLHIQGLRPALKKVGELPLLDTDYKATVIKTECQQFKNRDIYTNETDSQETTQTYMH